MAILGNQEIALHQDVVERLRPTLILFIMEHYGQHGGKCLRRDIR